MSTVTDFVKPVNCRKRIYGEEYNITTVLNVEPQPKILKLDQPEFEIISPTLVKKYQTTVYHDDLDNTTTPIYVPSPTPSKTSRNYSIVNLNHQDIPIICRKCFGVECICYLFLNENKRSS